jgi:MFS family permease
MALPTLAIGVLPTYRSIGNAAPLLLLTMRVMQGVAIGGEAPGAWVFVAEHARPERVGFAVGTLTCGLSSGIFLGSLIATGMTLAFGQAQIANELWRLPFVAGGAFGFIAMFVRRWLEETEMRRRSLVSQELPLQKVLRSHRPAIVASVLSTWMLTATILVLILMTPSLFQNVFRLSPADVQLANLAGTAALCLSTFGVAVATDRFGSRRVTVVVLPFLVICHLRLIYSEWPIALGKISFGGLDWNANVDEASPATCRAAVCASRRQFPLPGTR